MLARVLRWYRPYWSRVRGTLGLVFVLTVFGIATRTLYPLIFKFLIDALTEGHELSGVRYWVLVLLGVGLMRTLTQAFLPSTRAMLNLKVALGIRLKQLGGVLRKRQEFFHDYQPGDLVARLTDDIDSSDKLSWYGGSGVFRPIEAFLTLVFSLAVMFSLHWQLTLASTLPLPFVVWMMSRTEGLQHRLFQERQRATSATVETLESAFSGSRIAVGFGMEKAQAGLMDRVLQKRELAEKRVVSMQAIFEGLFAIMNQIGLVIVLFLGGYFVLTKRGLSLGDFYAFVAYLSGLTMPLWTISWFFVSTNVADTSINRMKEMEREPERSPGVETLTERHPGLRVRDLGFGYPGDPSGGVLRGVNLHVRPGETVALVGSVGCGKSTLLECAVGILDPQGGSVELGGRPVVRLTDDERAARIGYAPQEPLLFAGNVGLNVTLGRESIGEATVYRSLRTAQLSRELGVEQEVSPGGKGLSGGQRARVAVARTLAGIPDLLVLDDVTSALDARTESRFWEHLRGQLPDAGILVSTHREATAQQADRVLWLEDGKIQHEGTHASLLAEHREYQRLFAMDERGGEAYEGRPGAG